jgi:hypothetical protein
MTLVIPSSEGHRIFRNISPAALSVNGHILGVSLGGIGVTGMAAGRFEVNRAPDFREAPVC